MNPKSSDFVRAFVAVALRLLLLLLFCLWLPLRALLLLLLLLLFTTPSAVAVVVTVAAAVVAVMVIAVTAFLAPASVASAAASAAFSSPFSWPLLGGLLTTTPAPLRWPSTRVDQSVVAPLPTSGRVSSTKSEISGVRVGRERSER